MATYARRKKVPPACLIVALVLGALPCIAMAASSINFYSTSTASGTENFAVINSAGTIPMPQPVRLIAACSYNSSAPEVVMIFDATALPANGAVPKMQFSLPAASGPNAPACGSLALPAGGVSFYKGVVIAASISGKTLSIDTASGGNMFFETGY